MNDTTFRAALVALRDHLLAVGACFQQGFAPARADGFRVWTWAADEPREVGPADHLGSYFYIRLRGAARYRSGASHAACGNELPSARLPLRLVAVAPCGDAFALERWLRHALARREGAVPILQAAEIDPLRVYRMERGPDAPLPEAFHLGRFALVALDFELELRDDAPACLDELPCAEDTLSAAGGAS